MQPTDALRDSDQPGRVCPPDYHTHPAGLARAPDIVAETMYVVGGLYGNAFALDAIERLAAGEAGPVTIVLNGDAHWFDAERTMFRELDARLSRYPAIAGNIEFELSRELDAGAGCGCAYPAHVPDDVVERSNTILRRLCGVLDPRSPIRKRFAALPKTLLAEVGGCRVGIVHGDARSLAGWGFSRELLDDPKSATDLDAIKTASRIDVFASTHTCEAVMRDFTLPSGRLVVANNGAAGMGNFRGDACGLITRISTRPAPHERLYGLTCGAVHVDALPVMFDLKAFSAVFDAVWPPGSAAEVSYRQRIQGQSAAGADPRRSMPLRR